MRSAAALNISMVPRELTTITPSKLFSIMPRMTARV